MGYAEIYSAANDAAFQGRCAVAMWTAANAIISEPANTENHAERFFWAQKVLRKQSSVTPDLLALQVLRNATIAGNPAAASDGDILYQVTQVIPDLIKIG